MSSVKSWTSCRVCSSSPLLPAVSLGNQSIIDFPTKIDSGMKVPLNLMMCEHCSLVQLEHSVSPDLLFKYFWYRSGINEQMRAALKDVVQKAMKIGGIDKFGNVLDIGCNDGTMLTFYPEDAYKVGVEPAQNIKQASCVDLVVHDFFNKKTVDLFEEKNLKFQVITAVAMFYDLDDPAEFLKNVEAVLAPGGVFIVQMNYLPTMLSNVAFDNISHEHVCYYSLISLKFLAECCGFEIVDCVENDVNGGSIRVYMTRRAEKPKGLTDVEVQEGYVRVTEQIQKEYKQQLNTPMPYLQFRAKVEKIKHHLNYLVKSLVEDLGRTVMLYGASTRGTVLMQTLNIEQYVLGACERDANKFYKTMVGTGTRIFPEDVGREHADYFLVLPWHFKESIFARELEWGKKGGKFIVPLPLPTVYALEPVDDPDHPEQAAVHNWQWIATSAQV